MRLNKQWRYLPACISKSILDGHHQTKLELKSYLCLSNSYQKICQNIVTLGVELRPHNTIFARFPMESLFGGVRPLPKLNPAKFLWFCTPVGNIRQSLTCLWTALGPKFYRKLCNIALISKKFQLLIYLNVSFNRTTVMPLTPTYPSTLCSPCYRV